MTHTIDLKRLRTVVDALIEGTEESYGQFVELGKEDDYYLDFTLRDWNEVLEPAQPVIGQISEDWDFLNNMQETDYGVTLMLTHAAAIMRFLAARGLRGLD